MVGVGFVAAFGGGIISFLSPCVLPVVPAYLSTITGLDLASPERDGASLWRIARDTTLFFCGFGAVFCALGVSATAFGDDVLRNQRLLERISGGVVIAMAVYLGATLVARTPRLFGEVRFHPAARRLGPFAAPVAGAAFGFGWTPCFGPVLASVVAVASTERELGRGALLLLAYAAGLGVPFLIIGLALGRIAGVLAVIRRHSGALTAASAVLLCGFGVLLMLGRLSLVTSELEAALRHVGLGRLVNLG